MRTRKFYKTVTVLLLTASSIIAMIEIKGRLEKASVDGSEDESILRTYFWFAVAVLVCSLGFVVISWIFAKWKEYRELKNQNIENELLLLKSKIDPHFFFNTLNNLYGLAKENSKDTPEVILKLSDIMRYVIYEGDNEKVPLSEDVAYVEKYLELHRIRYRDKTQISFNKEVDSGYQIAPLMLVILVENAIKHGLEKVSEKAYLKAKLKVENDQLTFLVQNSYDEQEKSMRGVGLQNLKRRLDLTYPQNHKLTTETSEDEFLAKLEINLK